METIDTSSAASEIQEVVNALTSMPSDTGGTTCGTNFSTSPPAC